MSIGNFVELSECEMFIDGGYYINVFGPFGIKVEYGNSADENAAKGIILGTTAGGAIAGCTGGVAGAVAGSIGGGVGAIIATASSDVCTGKATISFSVLGI